MNRTGSTLLVLSSLAFVSCCERELYPVKLPESPEAPKPSAPVKLEGDGSVNLLPGEQPDGNPSFKPVTEKIFAALKDAPAEMAPYTETAPLSGDAATFEMIPIKGGEFTIGSPDTEASRADDEGPQKKITIEPFWMAKTETTWALYQRFMENGQSRNKDGSLNLDGDIYSPEPPMQSSPETIDAISQPTPPYMPMHFDMADSVGYGKDLPAIGMTQHAASKFCEWLTAQTGHYYRLPTEAEWEYACRAGTTTAYSFGDDASKLGEYAWFIDNSDYTYHPVAQKKPNPWGLYDMHGNVTEWTLNAHIGDYAAIEDGAKNPLSLSPARYPRITRGGHWDTEAQDLRSAARTQSNKNWKVTDPQQPKSVWYHTDTPWLGFRIIRPLKVPSVEEMHLLWNTGPGKL
ncbi:formylglycine-generating enzyme family protein [bacterium]|nr:formylglycine-generating enzyme family protein [Akkermansiaceae bacterium]MDB4577189.1 formylglycine-generating enzyme family protein [bacterium]